MHYRRSPTETIEIAAEVLLAIQPEFKDVLGMYGQCERAFRLYNDLATSPALPLEGSPAVDLL